MSFLELAASEIKLNVHSFQFRALVQCQRRIDAIHNHEIYLTELAERIRTTCKLHLVWVFSIAQMSEGTWRPGYSVGGKSKASEVDKYTDVRPSYSVEGAFQFLKVCPISTHGEKIGNSCYSCCVTTWTSG